MYPCAHVAADLHGRLAVWGRRVLGRLSMVDGGEKYSAPRLLFGA
jgi:hypothetical protein